MKKTSRYISVVKQAGGTKSWYLELPHSALKLKRLQRQDLEKSVPKWNKISSSYGIACNQGFLNAYSVDRIGLFSHKGIKDGIYQLDIFEVPTTPQDSIRAHLLSKLPFKWSSEPESAIGMCVPNHSKKTPLVKKIISSLVIISGFIGFGFKLNMDEA